MPPHPSHWRAVYKNMTDAEFLAASTAYKEKKQQGEGFMPERWDGVTDTWHALDVRYDQTIGEKSVSV